MFAAKPENMSWVLIHRPTWYKETTDLHRLSSGVHVYTVALTHMHTLNSTKMKFPRDSSLRCVSGAQEKHWGQSLEVRQWGSPLMHLLFSLRGINSTH